MVKRSLTAALVRAATAAGLLATGDPARAQEPAEEPPAPKEDTFIDSGHRLVEGVLGTVLRLDRFFSDERDLDPIREQSFIRWRNEFLTTEQKGFAYATTVRASLRFPGLTRWWRERLRLVLEGDAEELQAPEALFGRTDATAPPPTLRVVNDAAAELRYAFVNELGFDVDAGIGVLLRYPPGATARLRMRYAQPFAEDFLARFVVTAFYRTDLRLGASGAFDVQRGLGDRTVVRLGTSVTVNEDERARGFQWTNDALVLHALTPLTALSAGATSIGYTRPLPVVTTYRVFVRYRRDVLRRWLFAEIEPGVAWPLTGPGQRERVLGLVLRLEVQFYGNTRLAAESEPERPSYEPDPSMPEPRDPP
jgi:hypothetical protein